MAAEIEEVCLQLSDRTGRIERVLNSGVIDIHHLQELTDYIVTIRSLLGEVGKSPDVAIDHKGAAGVSIRELQERFLELEGMVKEMRNELY